jgi:FAD/FMN-containing dehydrogenase
MRAASDDLSAQCNVLIAPPAPFVPDWLRGRTVVAIPVCHLDPARAERDLEPLRRLGPAVDRIKAMPYAKLQRMFDAAGVFGRCTFGRSGHLRELSDAVMNVTLRHALDITSPFSIAMISPLGGAVARVDDRATAFGHRRTAFDCAIGAVWTDPAEFDRHAGWVNRFWHDMRPLTDGVYVNELGDEGPGRVREAYLPSAHRRLSAIKRAVDPENFFRLNHNIEPGSIQEEPRC